MEDWEDKREGKGRHINKIELSLKEERGGVILAVFSVHFAHFLEFSTLSSEF